MKKLNKSKIFGICASIGIISILNKNVNATSFNIDINNGIDLYQVPYYYTDYVEVPSNFPTSFQIKAADNNSNIKYQNIEQDRGYTVSQDGLVELKVYDSYFYSDPLKLKITVENDPYIAIDDEEYITTINIKDYAQIYANQILDEYIQNNINSNMTQYEIARKACEFVCQYPYGTGSSSSTSLILYGYGDCFASCDVIEYVLNKFSITCAPRAAFLAGSTGSNHNNVVAILDGKLYQIEAGYNQKTTPRNYAIKEISNNGVEISSGIVKLYSGFDTQVIVPSTYGTYGTGTVKEIGEKAFTYAPNDILSITLPNTIEKIGREAFRDLNKLEYLNIPASITTIEPSAFFGCTNLKSIDLDSSNPNFSYENGIIYNKDKTKIIASLPGAISGNISFKSSVTEIGSEAFAYNSNITGISLGPNIKIIGADAFVNTNMTGITIPKTITQIGNYAFSNAKLSSIVIEKGNDITIGNNSFIYNKSALLYIPSEITNNLDNICSSAKSSYNTLMVENNSQILSKAQSTSTKYEIIDYSSKIELKDKLVIAPAVNESLIFEYTGQPINPEVKVQYGGYVLQEGKDYKITHTDNINVGIDIMTIEGIGDYFGKITRKISITQKEVDVKVKYDSIVYLGNDYNIELDSPVQIKTQSITYYDSNNNKLNNKPTQEGTYYFSVFATFDSNYSNYYEKYKYEIKEKPKYLKGDLDKNDVIDANDASIALEIFKAENASKEDIAIGDMDNNGLIDANDASLILELYKTNN